MRRSTITEPQSSILKAARVVSSALNFTLAILVAAVALPATASSALGAATQHDVELRIERETKTVTGVQRIELSAGNHVRFPVQKQQIASITVDGRAVGYIARDGFLEIDLGESLAPREMLIRYEVTEPAGLTFTDRSIYTGFDTCTWMICDPSPEERASLRLRITAPPGEQVVASGRLASVTDTGSGSSYEWIQERPYPAYLYGFVIGPLRVYTTEVDGRIFSTASAVADPEQLRVWTSAARGMVRYFETIAGLPLPDHRYTQVIVEGSAAQEKSTFSILGTNQLAALATDPTEDWLIAHELAHQFWGNLVTPRSWTEMWLSEGLVTFLTAAWKEHRWGREKYDREMELAARRAQYAVDESYDVPLSWPGEYPSLRVRRAIHYSRGALFFDALRRELGEETFWSALRRFTGQHLAGSVTSSDLKDSFEKSSGRDLEDLFRGWVEGPAER